MCVNMTDERKVTHRKKVHAPNKPSNGKDEDEKEQKENSKQLKNGKERSKYRYGPMPTFPHQRVWSRAVLIIGVVSVVWLTNKATKEIKLASQKDIHKNRGQAFECDRDYLDEIRNFPGCEPKKCGRYVMDTLITAKEAEILLGVAKRGMALGGSSGGATVLDLHSGALSYGRKFINMYSLDKAKTVIASSDLAIYKLVRSKIQKAIANNFEINPNNLHLTHPTFFSRMNNKDPQTDHDEYWHRHVDMQTYESFHYTSLLYLSDYGIDFTGGRFVFLTDSELRDQNITVEPRVGRVLMFTSGAENPHLVERVESGERYAVTISFTCNFTTAVGDPVIH